MNFAIISRYDHWKVYKTLACVHAFVHTSCNGWPTCSSINPCLWQVITKVPYTSTRRAWTSLNVPPGSYTSGGLQLFQDIKLSLKVAGS